MAKTSVKVIGIGGGGGNAIDRMVAAKISGVELIAANTDEQDLKKIKAHKKIRIGKQVTRGLGAGTNPELGRKAALESKEELTQALLGADLVFLAAGLGGGTGSGGISLLADIARSQGALVVAVVTKPFSFEGFSRMRVAERSLEELQAKVDTLLVVPNDQILKLLGPETTVQGAFWKADELLRQAVQGISDLITKTGIINVDFADVKGVMKNAGKSVFGIGYGKGEKRIDMALHSALHSSLLDISLQGAKAVLLHIAGPADLSLQEVQTAAQQVKKEVSPQAKIIFGALHDRSLKQGEVKITLIATGFATQ
ncbi:MAG: cell division protein FtsZ [Parcubacteria group bacterium Greene0714_21]|nr:MAG: cell division protein FtsZ [Parcubacteria group bacterium Greene0416_39]TSC98033.1 MAG: cell division protein FtsZ [Parcubacteria group bacterium Greene1014_47]TSD04176.1 MAG: cell division protein FtsZ [Parcubacteria group bacterium Greene0714_21]